MEEEPIEPEANEEDLLKEVDVGLETTEKRGFEGDISPGELIERVGDLLDPEEDIPFLRETMADMDAEDATAFLLNYATNRLLEQGRDPEEVFERLNMLP